MIKRKICLNVPKAEYEAFKKWCKSNYSSVTRELTLFMVETSKKSECSKCLFDQK